MYEEAKSKRLCALAKMAPQPYMGCADHGRKLGPCIPLKAVGFASWGQAEQSSFKQSSKNIL